MQCRQGCGACCVAPAISRPFYGMPRGKAAGETCVHLDAQLRCRLFDDPRRPSCCSQFQAEPAVCGDSRDQALVILRALETATDPLAGAPS
jgi:Fe-S-cluster containining protein